jgi:hypothetical protein
MRLPNSLLAILALSNFSVDASISIALKTTAQSYWYGRSYDARASSNEDSDIPFDISAEGCDDLYSRMSPAEVLCFLSGILRESHPALNKLTVWNYVKNKEIPQKDIDSLKSDNSKLKAALKANEKLLEKIKKFWGVNGNVHFHCFYSRANEKKSHFSGAWLTNFTNGDDIHAVVLMCGPSLASKKMTLNEHISVIAHEFTHAMCDAAYGREKFETTTLKFQSPNAAIAGWYLNEALAVVLGNGIFQEKVSGKKVDLSKEEYCARGFAPSLYDLVKSYFDNSKPMDEYFFENAVKLFDKVHPNGYMDPNICLYKLRAICPDDIKESDVILKLSKKTTVSDFYCTSFSKLTKDEIKETQNANATIMVIFRDKKQLKSLKTILPPFDDNASVSIIHKNKKTYVFIKIDDKHSLEDRINELFSKTRS